MALAQGGSWNARPVRCKASEVGAAGEWNGPLVDPVEERAWRVVAPAALQSQPGPGMPVPPTVLALIQFQVRSALPQAATGSVPLQKIQRVLLAFPVDVPCVVGREELAAVALAIAIGRAVSTVPVA